MVQGENGLYYKAEFDINEFKKNGTEMLRLFKEIQLQAEKTFAGPSGQGAGFAQAQLKMQSVSKATRQELEKLKIEEQELINANIRSGAATVDLTNKLLANKLAQQELIAARKAAKAAEKAAAGSYQEASNRLKQLGIQIRSVAGGFEATGPIQQARIREYTQLNSQLQAFDRTLGNHQRNVGNYGGTLQTAGAQLKTMIAGYLTFTAAIAAARKLVGANAEISDSLSDVQRTAGLTANEVERLTDSLKQVDTRTSLKGLTDIATIGGQLGIAKDELTGFTKAIDVLAVVLSGEIKGGAEDVASSLGKINGVFKVQQSEGTNTEESLNKTGSAILALGQAGLATGEFLQDFSLRVAGTAQTAKIALPTVLAYSAVLEESGISAEVAGTAFNKLVSSLASKREDFFKIAQIGDASLTLKEFTNTINTDANKALQQFFIGLNKGGTDLTSFTDLLDTLKIRTGPGKNAIIALAQNQEILNTRIGQSTEAYKEGTLAAEQFRIKNENLASALSKLGNFILNIFTSSSGSRNTAKFINDLVSGQTETDKLSESYKANKKESEALDAALKPLITKYDKLTTSGALTKDKQAELRDVTAQIGVLLPGVTTKFDEYGNALDINRDKVNLLTKAQKELLELQNRSAIEAANKQFDDAQKHLPAAKKAAIETAKDTKSRTIGSGLLEFKSASWFTFGEADAKEIQERTQKSKDAITTLSGRAYDAAKAIRDLGGVLTEAQKKIIAYYETVNKPVAVIKPAIVKPGDVEEDDNTGEGIKNQIEALEAKRKAVDITSAAYKNYTEQILKLKDALKSANGGTPSSVKDEETSVKRAKDLQDRLAAVNAKYSRKTLTKDGEEVQQIRDELKTITDEIYTFNQNPKNKVKITGEEVKTLKGNLQNAIDDKIYEQQAAKQLESLDKQKRQYADYENYRLTFGNAAAKKRFEGEIDIQSTYLQKLEAEQKKITDIKPEDRTGSQTELSEKITTRVNFEKEAEKSKQDDLLKSLRTFDQLRIAATDKYYADLALLGNNATAEQIKDLYDAYAKDVDGYANAANAKTEIAKRMSEEVLVLTRSQIKEQISGLENAMKDVTIPSDIKEKIQNTINDLKIRLDIGVDQVNLDTLKSRRLDVLSSIETESKNATPNVSALNKELAKLNIEIDNLDPKGTGKVGGLKKFLDGVKDNKTLLGTAKGLNLASDAAMTLSQGLGGVDTAAGYTLDTIGQLAGAAGDLAGAIVSGDPVKIIGSAIKAVGTLFSIGKKVREMNAAARKEVEDYYSNAIAGEREYQDVLKQRQIETVKNNKIVLQGIRDEIALRSSQTAAYAKESQEIMVKLQGQSYVSSETYTHGTWFRKASTNKTYDSLQGKSFAELSQLLAQGKLEGDTKALVERLSELEQKGYDAEQAMADLAQQTSEIFTGTTSDSLTDSLLEMFKSGKTGAQDLADFFKQSMDDAALSIFKNKILAGAMEDFYKKFDEAAQSGDELTSDEIATLNGLFTSLTSDALKKFEEFKKITGSDLTGSSSNTSQPDSLRGAVTPISSETEAFLCGSYARKQKVIIPLMALNDTPQQGNISNGDQAEETLELVEA